MYNQLHHLSNHNLTFHINRPLLHPHDNKLMSIRDDTPNLNDKALSTAVDVKTHATLASDQPKSDARVGGLTSRGWGQLTFLTDLASRQRLSFAADIYLCEW